MKKSVSFLSLLMGLALAFPLNPQAKETIDHSGLYIEGEIAAGFPTEDGLDEGAFYGGRAGYRFNNYFAAEIESGHADLGTISIVPLMGNLRIHPFPGKTIDPYIVAGLGGLFNDIDVDEEELSDAAEVILFTEFGIDEFFVLTDVDIENAFAGQVGVGTLIHFTENLSAFVEAKVLLAQADIKTTVTFTDEFDTVVGTGSAKDSVDLHTVFVGAGLRLRF